MEKPWSLPSEQVIANLKSNRLHGLSSTEARNRLRSGFNELRAREHSKWLETLIRQIKSPLILILCFALALSIIERQVTDAVVIALVVIANVLVGYFQETKAEETIRQLRKILAPQSRVIRDSVEQKIAARLLVPGDIVLLEAGDRVPADGRLLESQGLQINEAPLTGESLPVIKREGLIAPATYISGRVNMAYLSTLVTSGQGVMIVTETGLKTELGKIAEEVVRVSDQPEEITKQISRLGLWLMSIAFVLGLALFLIGLARGNSLLSMVNVAISLLVSMVPEGLPIAVTVCLSVGLVSVFRSKAIIRKLAAAETLGSVNVICVDKTGTITEDKLMVERLWVGGQEYRVDGTGRGLTGHFYADDQRLDITKRPPARLLLELSSLATMSTIDQSDLKKDEARPLTDATETALAVVAAKAGFYAFKEEKDYPEILEIPYDHRHRYSASVHRFGRVNRMIVKGAPEEILKLCQSQIGSGDKTHKLLTDSRAKLEEAANHYAHQGYRVIALAYGDEAKTHSFADHKAHNLTFVGFLCMIDPIRVEAKPAIGEAQAAGIRVMMLTGDHLLTAETIAQKVGIGEAGSAIHASDLDHHSLEKISVIARLSPKEKLTIVESLQRRGDIVAMTGDGVNDAPALKRADIGIAMGRGGTDVAIEAADMVLLSNNFSAITAAIKQGRLIWENLRKIIYYLVATSVAEALIVIGSLALGWPLPLLAVQILWMNLVTDGVTSISLAFETPEQNLMTKKARPKGTNLVNAVMGRRIALATLTMTVATLALFHGHMDNLPYAQTVALTVMVFFQIFNLFASRSETTSVFRLALNSNRPLLGLFFVSLVLQLLAIYHPLGNRLLHTVPLSVETLLQCIGIGLLVIVVDELRKLTSRLLKTWARNQKIAEE